MLKSSLLWAALALFLFTATRADMSYSVVSSDTDPGHTYYTAVLKYNGNDTNYINQSNAIIQYLNFTYFFVSSSHLIVRVTDANNSRWEVPYLPPFPHVDLSKKFGPYDNAGAKIDVTENPFSFKVTRPDTNEVIFDTSVGDFIYTDYYIQVSTSLTTPNLYGMGERAYKLNLGPDGTYSIFTKDNPVDIEDGTSGHNLYGYHPVYLLREKSNDFNAVLLRSSVGMDVVVQGGNTLTYKVIGGILDFNFFLGDTDKTPEGIIKQYHSYLGGWTLQPFWSFGFHQCRWGYASVNDLINVLSNYSANSLPLDVIWSDINYMDHYIDFTVDSVNFPPVQMNDMLEIYQKRWVPIIDAGVAVNNTIHTWGANNNVYLKDPNGTYLEGVVWPGNVNYPDFWNPNASLFWDLGLDNLQKQIPFSGIWNDMNEASNFVPGEVGFVADASDILNNPPYKPAKQDELIYTKTERMDAVHYGGVLEYYAHNTFGFFEGKATYNYLKTIHDLVFILTRSSFYGSGQWVAHWTGDNASTFQFLALSIPGIINSGIYGMPMAGADICGFAGDTTPELCARWFQLGTMYPFSRDHNSEGQISQEPYALGPTVLQTARVSLALRYSIARHYYAQFLRQNGTGTIFRPVFFEYPTDNNLFDASLNITDSQFLIGSSLMIAPVLIEGATSVSVYFPQDTWFDYIDGTLIQSAKQSAGTLDYAAPLNTTVPIFIRGGYIVPNQDVTNVNRTDDLDNQYQLVIAFKETQTAGTHTAQGELIGIANFSDSNVLEKCKEDNCLYNLDATITLTNTSYDLTVNFNAQGTASNYEAVSITSLFMMGDWEDQIEFAKYWHIVNELETDALMMVLVEELSSNVIRYTFNPPFNVTNGAKIQISSPLIDV